MTQPPIVEPGTPPVVPPGDPPPVPPVEPVVEPPWTSALPEGVKGFAELKGWKDPAEAIRSYQSLEQLRGVPEEQLLRLPGDPEDQEGWNTIYSRLGRPDDAAGYELAPADLPEGTPDLTSWFAEQAFAAGLSKQKGQEIVANYGAKMAELAQEQVQARLEQNTAEKNAVMREWGTEAQTNVQAAQRFAGQMKWDPETMVKLENALGTKRFMETLALLGRATSEHTFVGPDFETDEGFGMTPSAATAQIAKLKGDKVFLEAYMRGDKDAVARMTELQKLAAPEPTG